MRSVSVHIYEIYKKGYKELFRKIRRFHSEDKLFKHFIPLVFCLLISIIWALPIVILIRCLKRFIIIRICEIESERIGHYIPDASEQFARIHKQNVNTVDWFWMKEPTCNEQWSKMVKRNLPIYSWVKYLDYWNRVIPGGAEHRRPSSMTGSRDVEGLLYSTKYKIEFLPEESISAKNWLRRQGWTKNEPFVCLLVRDFAYLSNDPLHAGPFGPGHKYHDFRDSDIATYYSAIKWLADQGVWVLRMGKIMEKPISINHPRIIDYAFHSEKSDLMDIWLFTHCNLCISTGTGIDKLPEIYSNPLLVLNLIPLLLYRSYTNMIGVPKYLIWGNTGKELNCSEYFQNSFTHSKKYIDKEIKIVDLESNMILETVKEAWQSVQGTWLENAEDIKRKNKFNEILKNQKEFHKLNRWLNPKARLSSIWLRKMGVKFLE